MLTNDCAAQINATYRPANSYLYLKLFPDGQFEYLPALNEMNMYSSSVEKGHYKVNDDTISLYGTYSDLPIAKHIELVDTSLAKDSFTVVILAKNDIPYLKWLRVNNRTIHIHPDLYLAQLDNANFDIIQITLPAKHIHGKKNILMATSMDNYAPIHLNDTSSNTIITYINAKNPHNPKSSYYVYDDKFIIKNDTLFRLGCNIDTCKKTPFIKDTDTKDMRRKSSK